MCLIMKLNNLKAEKIIDKDFDQFKKILEVPENVNKFIAFSQYIGNFTVNEITNEAITGNYWIGKFKYDISFTKNDENKIIYQFKATNYYYLSFGFFGLLIYRIAENSRDLHHIALFLLFFLGILLLLYLINSQVRKDIYNRIYNRWDRMNYVDSTPFAEGLIEADEINEIVKNGLNMKPKRKDYKSSSDYVQALRKYHESNNDNK